MKNKCLKNGGQTFISSQKNQVTFARGWLVIVGRV